MTSEDMAALHARCFPDRPWSAREIEDLLQSRSVQRFVSAQGDGLLLARVLPPEAEILTLAVDPDARRCGVGAGLLEKWIRVMARQDVTDLHLEVAADNLGALALYDCHGFEVTGRRPRYYARPEAAAVDALLMRRTVTRRRDRRGLDAGPRIG